MGTFSVTNCITSTTYQVQDNVDPSVVKTELRNHLVEDYPEEEPLPAKIENIVPPDQRQDDFHEQFLEQRIEKINNSAELITETFTLFPIEPLSTVPLLTSQKRVSTNSTDSGVGSPRVFSPSLPLTTDHLPQES